MSWFDDNGIVATDGRYLDPSQQGPMPNAQGMSQAPSAPTDTGGAPQNGPAAFSKGMSDDQVRALANQYISAGGAKNTDNGQYWVDKYHEFGANDPAYFQTRLQQGVAQQPGYNGSFGAAQNIAPGSGNAPGPPPPMPTPITGTSIAGNPGSFQAPAPFSYQSLQTPAAFQAPAPFSSPGGVPTPNHVSYNPYQQAAPYQPGQINPGMPISAPAVGGNQVQTPQITPQGVARPGTITPQTVQGPAALGAQQNAMPSGYATLTAAQLAQDPSYQFRLQQGLQALTNSASANGTYFTPNTIKGLSDYAGQSASQEYAAANQRNLATYQANVGNALQTTQANQANQAQSYGLTHQYQQQAALANQQQSLAAQQANVGNQLAAGTFNANLGQQAQMQNAANALQANQANAQLGQGAQIQNAANTLQAGQFNSQLGFNAQAANQANRMQAYGLNAQTGLAANQANNQGFFNAAQANTQNALQAQQAQYGQGANTYGMNFANSLAAQQNAFNQALGVQGQQFGQGLGAYQANTGAALNAYQANVGAGLGFGNLGLGYTQAQNQYALGSTGLSNQAQQIGNQAAQFGQNFGLQQNQSNFGQLYSLAALGQQAASATGNYGSQYGANAGNLITGQGNAQAAGQVGSANAWNNALGNLGNLGGSLATINALNQGPYGTTRATGYGFDFDPSKLGFASYPT